MNTSLASVRCCSPSLFLTRRSAPALISVLRSRGLLKKQATMAGVLIFKSWQLTFAPCCNNNSKHSGLSTIPREENSPQWLLSSFCSTFTSTGKVQRRSSLIIAMVDTRLFVSQENSNFSLGERKERKERNPYWQMFFLLCLAAILSGVSPMKATLGSARASINASTHSGRSWITALRTNEVQDERKRKRCSVTCEWVPWNFDRDDWPTLHSSPADEWDQLDPFAKEESLFLPFSEEKSFTRRLCPWYSASQRTWMAVRWCSLSVWLGSAPF